MLNKIRNFAKTKLAGVFVGILIIPFVLWGMGGVFSSGNTNSVAKVNNKNISTQDLMNFLNSSNIDKQAIRDNLENNVLEQLVSTLISEKLLEMEIDDLNLVISEEALANNIKNNPNFFDDDNKFSRIKYEKFLLSSNITAAEFERRVKKNELQKKLFYYIGGGIKSPSFITNKTFKEKESKINLEYLNLSKAYLKKKDITKENIEDFINENVDELKEEYINFSYIKIDPQNLVGSNEYSQDFFNKIDEIENEILNGKQIEGIALDYNLSLIDKKNYISSDENNQIENKIYNERDNKVDLFDDGNFYVLYQIKEVNKILPKISDKRFKNKVTNILIQKNKYEFNKKILEKIKNNKFFEKEFNNLSSKNSIQREKLQLNSIEDFKIFTEESVKIIYTMPENSFTLVNDDKDNIYLVKINTITHENISQNSEKFLNYTNEASTKLREHLYSSYDFFLNGKYKVKTNQKTIERVKNYFK